MKRNVEVKCILPLSCRLLLALSSDGTVRWPSCPACWRDLGHTSISVPPLWRHSSGVKGSCGSRLSESECQRLGSAPEPGIPLMYTWKVAGWVLAIPIGNLNGVPALGHLRNEATVSVSFSPSKTFKEINKSWKARRKWNSEGFRKPCWARLGYCCCKNSFLSFSQES